jgi:hypothetical protein
MEGLQEEDEEQEQGDVKTVDILRDEEGEKKLRRLRGRKRRGQDKKEEKRRWT